MTEYLLKDGFLHVTLCDQNVTLDGVPESVTTKLGSDYLSGLEQFDIVFRSPGISFLRPEIQRLMGSRTVVSSMTKYFFEHCPTKIIGVTGTKGKGTTASLITEILRHSGRKVFLGGNIGVPAVSFLDEVHSDDIVVLELSSFQLADLETSPHIAVVLNVTSEHMDYHTSVEEYRESKYSIMAYQEANDFAVLNADYPYSQEFSSLGDGEKLYVGFDMCLKGDRVMNVIDRGEIALLGRHNLENIFPSIRVAKLLRVSDEIIARVLREFRGLPHRLEPVMIEGERGEHVISCYNDSFSTTPESCIAACATFEELGRPFFLLAGGSEKGSDFSELGTRLSEMKFLKKIYVMGPSGTRITEAVAGNNPSSDLVESVGSLREGVQRAYDSAKVLPEAVILMSPAAASFNEFKNYKERGEIFKMLVKEIVK